MKNYIYIYEKISRYTVKHQWQSLGGTIISDFNFSLQYFMFCNIFQ